MKNSIITTPQRIWVWLTISSFCLVGVVHGFAGVTTLLSSPSTSATTTTTTTTLWSTPPKRTARRNLQKRRRRRDGASVPAQQPESVSSSSTSTNTNTNTNIKNKVQEEIRPLISSEARAQGADYWIDEQELARYQQAQERRQTLQPGQVTNEKLWEEVLSPYKQNWIGWISVVIVMITTIVVKFPALLQSPVIPIPDL